MDFKALLQTVILGELSNLSFCDPWSKTTTENYSRFTHNPTCAKAIVRTFKSSWSSAALFTISTRSSTYAKWLRFLNFKSNFTRQFIQNTIENHQKQQRWERVSLSHTFNWLNECTNCIIHPLKESWVLAVEYTYFRYRRTQSFTWALSNHL